jgi:NTE family protein
VLTGNFAYFDNRDRLEPEHTMASGALPPGFPPVDDRWRAYWDGGIVSNTPLQGARRTKRGGLGLPGRPVQRARADAAHAGGAAQREKDIRYSSRTRLNTDMQKRIEALEAAAARLADKLPEDLRDDPDVALLRANSCNSPVTILHLINRGEDYETQSKDYEFSRMTMEGHYRRACTTRRSFASPRWKKRHPHARGIATLDLA